MVFNFYFIFVNGLWPTPTHEALRHGLFS